MLKTIILAWWSGTRLWPISRKYYPKQFVKLKELDWISLFQMTLKRALRFSTPDNIIVVTNANYKFHCMSQADEVGIKIKESQILVEPIGKNTLPAITFAMTQLDEWDFALILPSDHIIDNEDRFYESIHNSLLKAQDGIVTFGITPFCPHTGYGYIEVDKSSNIVPLPVKSFREKPNKQKAEEFIKAWYYWNAWIFLFSKKIFDTELKKYALEIHEIFRSKDSIEQKFEDTPDLSIDYWILEKSDKIFLTPLDIYWSDLGSFDAIDDYLKEKNYKNYKVINIDWENNFVLSEVTNKKVAIIWLDDLIVVDTPDALLIAKKWETQKIKDVFNILKEEKSITADFWVTVYRPWGSYTIIDEWIGFKSKRITVLPGKKLSLQMHYHRSEHWVVVAWSALVTIWEEEVLVKKWESVFIPTWTKHRLENPWKMELHLIESQIGDYLEEDDIVRFDDDFGRK